MFLKRLFYDRQDCFCIPYFKNLNIRSLNNVVYIVIFKFIYFMDFNGFSLIDLFR